MEIYHYSHATGEFITTGEARPDPLEKGRFLIPGFATEKRPPSTGENEVAAFDGVAWGLKADFRGVKYWLPDGGEHTVVAIGETVPEGALLSEPDAPTPAPVPDPSPAEIEAAKIDVVQQCMDDAARALRYDNITTAITYAEEPAVPKFQSEGRAFRAWRSLVWAFCYGLLDDVKAGRREVPTDEDLIASLPVLELPPDA